MSKELTPLKALEEIKRQVGNIHYFAFTQNIPTMTTIQLVDTPLFKIVENALKALDIIKETPEFAWYVKIYDNAYDMASDVKGFRLKNSVEELQKMFDLLKEVLDD